MFLTAEWLQFPVATLGSMTAKQGSNSLWLPDTKDLSNFPVGKDLKRQAYLGEGRNYTQVSCLFTAWAAYWRQMRQGVLSLCIALPQLRWSHLHWRKPLGCIWHFCLTQEALSTKHIRCHIQEALEVFSKATC